MGVEVDFRGTPRFEVLSRLGAGSSGVVYQAFDRTREREVALKALRSRDAVAVQRFQEEFAACRSVAHPNLVRFEEMFEAEGQWFFTMELVQGLDLMSYLRPPSSLGERRFDAARGRSVLRQLAESLYALHQAGRVHRDVKPSNVRVTAEGRAVLLDLGLATEIVALASEASGVAVGTPQYCAPEQALGAEASPAADWYSFGAVLFEALTGRPVFEGSIQRMLEAKTSEEAPDPRSLCPELPQDLAELCQTLLWRDPARRPTGFEVLAALGGHSGLVPARHSRAPDLTAHSKELTVLRDALARSRKGSLHVHVVGASAAGKSRLLDSFAKHAASEGAIVLCARCHAAPGEPLEPWQTLARELATAFHKLALDGNVARDAGPLGLMLPPLCAMESVAEALRGPKQGSLITQRSRALETLRSILRSVGERAPVLIAVDDFDVIDEDSARVFDALFQVADPACVLLVTTGHRAVAAGKSAPEELVLAGLDASSLLNERARSLSGDARLLLQALSVVEHPVSLQMLSEVTRLSGAQFSQGLSLLLDSGLVRSVAFGETKRLEPTHRLLTKALATNAQTRELCSVWAVAMHGLHGEPEALLADLAGLKPRVQVAARRLALRAREQFAFALEARMLALAFEARVEPSATESLSAHVEVGEALTLAGRAAEAARRFLVAGEFAKGADALPLRRRAAELLMQAGQIDEASKVLDDLLRAVDMKPMSTTGWSLSSIAWHRGVLALRGYDYKRRSVQEIVPRKLAEVDVTWSVAQIASTAKTLQGLDVQTRGLRRALLLGEPYRVARALATEAGSLAASEAPPQPKAHAALLTARKLVEEIGDPGLDAACDVSEAVTRFFGSDMRGSFALATQAERKLRALTDPPNWETTFAQSFTMFSANAFAQVSEALALYERFIDEARARGDAFAEAMLTAGARGYLATMNGDTDTALAEVDAAMSAWRETDLHFLHVYKLLSVAHVDVYRGDPLVLQRVDKLWPQLSRGGLLRLLPLRPFLARVRGAALIETVAARGTKETAKAVRKEAQAAAAAKYAGGQGIAQILEAGAHVLLGQDTQAIAALEEADRALESTGMENWRQAARYHLGRLKGGDAGQALRDAAQAAMRERGILDPERFAHTYATGCSR